MAAIALLLAMIAGFAAQRGSICAVAAVRDLVVDRDARRYVAFFECAAWSLAVLTAARALGIASGAPPQDYSPGVLAAAGGALFGAGALANGACTFGTAARLGRGEAAFAATPIGFLFGVVIASKLAAAPTARMASTDATSSGVAMIGVGLFVCYQLFRIGRVVGGPREALGRLVAQAWRPSLAMGIIGLTSALLMIFFAPWPYSNLLIDLGVGAASDEAPLKIALAIAFVGGAALDARLRGVLKIVAISPKDVVEKATGGALMGAGSYLIPGGNDSLILVGLPHLFGFAMIAYLSMSATIAAMLVLSRGGSGSTTRPS